MIKDSQASASSKSLDLVVTACFTLAPPLSNKCLAVILALWVFESTQPDALSRLRSFSERGYFREGRLCVHPGTHVAPYALLENNVSKLYCSTGVFDEAPPSHYIPAHLTSYHRRPTYFLTLPAHMAQMCPPITAVSPDLLLTSARSPE